jgi:hypothetical protein
MLMANVVRLSDRFLDRSNPESIDRQERLLSCLALVSIFYLILSIAFVKMGELEKRHRVYHPDPSVQFELMIAPPDPKPVPVMPAAPSLVPGRSNTGGQNAASVNSEVVDIPAVVSHPPIATPAAVIPHPRVNPGLEAPVAVVSSNPVRPAAPVVSPSPTVPATPQSSDTTTQGNAANEGVGVDPAGEGNGGTGSGAGTAHGTGDDSDLAGGRKISTALQSASASGNIGPYRKALLLKLAQVWRPAKKHDYVVVGLRLAQDGALIDSWIIEQSSAKAGKSALEAVRGSQYDHLPDWYRGEELSFKLTLQAQ